jgi:hypothetical protein
MSKIDSNLKQKALKNALQKFKGSESEKKPSSAIELGKRTKPNIDEHKKL